MSAQANAQWTIFSLFVSFHILSHHEKKIVCGLISMNILLKVILIRVNNRFHKILRERHRTNRFETIKTYYKKSHKIIE